MENKSNVKNEWIKIPSKNYMGRHYLFNIKTGESRWCPTKNSRSTKNEEVQEKETTGPFSILGRLLRTPAQNRLKRLQRNLAMQKSSIRSTPRVLQKHNTSEAYENNIAEDMPSTSHNRYCTIQPQVRNMNANHAKAESSNMLLNGTVLINKIKDFCKRPFSFSSEATNNKKDNGKESIANVSKENDSQNFALKEVELRNALEVVIRGLKGYHEDQEKNATKTKVKDIPTRIVPCDRISANARLELLRATLMAAQSSSIAVNTSNSQKSTDKCSSEAMDWEPIVKTEPIDLTGSDSEINSSINSKGTSTLISSNTLNETNDSTIMADLLDTVNENLLRISMEKNKELNSGSKWLKDYYYFVLDTNVLLEYLGFIDDLSKIKLSIAKGVMLYIPYCVLQELDKLKQGFGKNEGVKTLAVRAIKYLNKKFEKKAPNLSAQSAMEEKRYVIKVVTPDDSIINCCLQVKENIPNVVLLTEDINLRNKAICNDIIVTTKSDLMVKHNDANANSPRSSINNNSSNLNNNNDNNDSNQNKIGKAKSNKRPRAL